MIDQLIVTFEWGDNRQLFWESLTYRILARIFRSKFIVKSNINSTLKFYIDNDIIHCNSKRLVNVLDPVSNNDAVNKNM